MRCCICGDNATRLLKNVVVTDKPGFHHEVEEYIAVCEKHRYEVAKTSSAIG